MIKDGFMYIAVLIFLAAILVNLPRDIQRQNRLRIFSASPACGFDLHGNDAFMHDENVGSGETSRGVQYTQNPVLYAMLFLMLLRCDMKKILEAGTKDADRIFAASISIGLGFVVSFAVLRDLWDRRHGSHGRLCGSWMGGGGNMLWPSRRR